MDFLNPSFWLFVAVIAGIYGIMALGLYVQYSLAGLPNFGHVAFMAVAAYGMAILVVRFEAPLFLAAVSGLLAAVFLAIIMGRQRCDCAPTTSLSLLSPAARSSAISR